MIKLALYFYKFCADSVMNIGFRTEARQRTLVRRIDPNPYPDYALTYALTYTHTLPLL